MQQQSRLSSLIEASSSVALGYCISVAAGFIIYPAFGAEVTVAENMGITLAFTVLSLTRTYVTRRLFNWLETRKARRA